MLRWLVLALAACGGGSAHAIDAAPDVAQTPDVNGMDIVVSSTGVVVWVGFTGVLAANSSFPAAGMCSGMSDTVTVAPNCFAGIDIDNVSLDPEIGEPTPNNPYHVDRPTTASSMLSASDCGRRIEIPLHAGPFPIATSASAMEVGSDTLISWTTTAPYTLVTRSFGVGVDDCIDIGASQHHFTGGAVGASVQPLAAPETTQTDLGEVRVWYGDRTDITIP